MKELLEQFVADYSYGDDRDWLRKPLHIGEYDVATNGHNLIAVKQDNGYMKREETTATIAIEENILKFISAEGDNREERISVEQLRKCVEFCTTKQMVWPMEPCEHCKGDGTVVYTHDYNNTEYEVDEECPACQGKGETRIANSTQKEVVRNDMSKYIKIGEGYMYGEVLNKVLITAEHLKQDFVTLVRSVDRLKEMRFVVGEAIVIAMPCRMSRDNVEFDLNGDEVVITVTPE